MLVVRLSRRLTVRLLEVRTTVLRCVRLVVSPLKLVLGLVQVVQMVLSRVRVAAMLLRVLTIVLCMATLGLSPGLRLRKLIPTFGRGCVLFRKLPLTLVTTWSIADPLVLPRFSRLTPVLGKKDSETLPTTLCPGGMTPSMLTTAQTHRTAGLWGGG